MPKLELENSSSNIAASGGDSVFSAVGEVVKARPAEFARALGERLHLIGTGVQLFSDPHARADLLAVDPQGAAVLVVVEREGEHSLLERGLMCAGLVAGWKPDFFFRYPTAGSADKLQDFLEIPGEEMNGKQRVVLVAHSHDYAVFTASQWLAQQHGIEIWCVQGRLDPESDRLELVRLESASFHAGEPGETVRVVIPHASADAPESGELREPGSPLEPALAPLVGSVTGTCRLRTIWQPAAEPVTLPEPAPGPEPEPLKESIEQRALQILKELPKSAAPEAVVPNDLLEAGSEGLSELPAESEQPVPEGRKQPAPETSAPEPPATEPPATGQTAVEQAAPEQAAPEQTPTEQSAPKPKAAEQPATDEPAPEPAATEASTTGAPGVQPAPAIRRRPFRIVGLMALVGVLSTAGLLVLTLPERQTPDQAGSSAKPVGPPVPAAPEIFTGAVIDRVTGRPIPGARLYYAGQPFQAGEAGQFEVKVVEQERRLLVKATGYRQTESSMDSARPIRLDPIEVRGYFVSHSQVADPSRRASIMELIRGTSANAVILGVKDVSGRVNVAVDHPLARELQAASSAAKIDLARQVAAWKAEGIYTIALLALFKDDLVARKKTDLALRSLHSRQPIIDADGIAWADPSLAPVREYNIAVAEAAAAAGFDEIHFDFIRYPSEGLSREGGDRAEYQRRLQTLVEFLRRAGESLGPYNVYLSASVFGSVCVMPRASVIGQKLEEFAENVDYVSPMLYPSYFEPGRRFPFPLRNSYQLVYENLLLATRRLGGQNDKLRPWLQNFPDRASPKEPLKADSIFGQVKAAEDARASGWMLWDARSIYRNTVEAMTKLNNERPNTERSGADAGGASLIPGSTGGGSLAASAGERLRLVAVLFMAGWCLAVLYGAVRAAWLFRQWNRTGPAARSPQPDDAAPRDSAWLPRPQFLRGLHHAGPR